MANKLKVAEKFSAIKTMLNGEKVENFSIEQAVEFINERIAMVEKKSAPSICISATRNIEGIIPAAPKK